MNSRDYAVQRFVTSMSWAVLEGHLTEAQAERLKIIVKEYFATHWRDDDSPQAERTFGVRRSLTVGLKLVSADTKG